MRRVLIIWIALLCVIDQAFSQNIQTQTEKNVVISFYDADVVGPGEFQMELLGLQKGIFTTDNPRCNYVYITHNRFTKDDDVWVNGISIIQPQKRKVRTYKIGPTLENCVFVIKNSGISDNTMGKGMERVFAYGVYNPICDTVMFINDDGFVCSRDGKFYYCQFMTSNDKQSKKEVQIVWPQRKYYETDLKFDNPHKTEALGRLDSGDVYFESPDPRGHYYYLYRDKFMPNTVLVVDDLPVELYGVYDEENLKFKFSYNGKHWMAVGCDCFWVDGELRSVEGYEIIDFVITDNGHYWYVAYEKNSSNKNAVVICDGVVRIRRNAELCYFGLDAPGGTMKIRFFSDNRYLQYECEPDLQYKNDTIIDMTRLMTSIYYPEKEKDRAIQVVSPNGVHKLTYRCDSVSSVEIDGVKVADSKPCYAIFDERSNSFVWNAIEHNGTNIELMIYRCPVIKKKSKKLQKK